MSDYSVSPVTKYESNLNVSNMNANVTARVNQAASLPASETVERPKTPERAPVGRSSDVYLRFQVDEQTRDVTVFVVDRSSRSVLRTIPPDELNKLRAGDLLELFA